MSTTSIVPAGRPALVDDEGARPATETGGQTEDFYERLREAGVVPLWRVPGTDAPEPVVEEVPHLWRWQELHPLLNEAGKVDLGGGADRRALNAVNPTRRFGTTHTMVAGYQLVLPGETAPAHRHTPGAIRFMLSGRGHTVVEGEPIFMEPGDLVLTPSWTWHDHRQEGEEPMVWLDGLDVPFVRGLNAWFYEDHPGGDRQPVTQGENASRERYAAGLLPVNSRPPTPHSPLTIYKWADSVAALRRLHVSEGKPAEGVSVEYVNPTTGGHAIPTMACFLQLVPASGATPRRRHTSSTIVCVASGSGHSIIGGERFDWDRNDFLAVPSWTWYEHVPDEGAEAVLFVMSDRPLLDPFNLYREETA